MTARAAQPKAHANGAALTPAVLEDRVTALEDTVLKLANAVAQLLTQAVQPQLQAGILAGLTGQHQPPVKAET